MSYIQFYKNSNKYPNYSGISSVGEQIGCTPVGMNLKGGTIRVAGNLGDFDGCNYLEFSDDKASFYAWIEDIVFKNAGYCDITYKVDAWRTYRNKITLGEQYIVRSPEETNLRDEMLGNIRGYEDIATSEQSFQVGKETKRIFVIQTRTSQAELNSNSPVQPTPYQFFFTEYDINNWQNNHSILALMGILSNGAESLNLVTMYSMPYFDTSSFSSSDLVIKYPNDVVNTVSGFKFLGGLDNIQGKFVSKSPIMIANVDMNELLRSEHSVQVVIPDAGIIKIPDELIGREGLSIVRDIDLFSGACNYMITDGYTPYNLSVRSAGLPNVPILSDAKDTYISQNKNALTVGLLADAGAIVGGMATGNAGAVIGGGMSVAGKYASVLDAGSHATNPIVFLGSALINRYNGMFWVIVTKKNVTNANSIHSRYGYPYGSVRGLYFPTAGFISTQNCCVSCDGTVPSWAIDEVNAMFDRGVLVK